MRVFAQAQVCLCTLAIWINACAARAEVDSFGRQPLASHEELEAQYKAVYNNHHASSSAEFNLGLVTLLVMAGLGIVFGLPWLVAQNRRRRRAGGAASQGGLLGLFDWMTRKRGHVN